MKSSEEEERNEVEISQHPFRYEVTSEKSVPIDFSGHEEHEALITLIELPTEGDAVKSPEGEIKVFVSTNNPEQSKIELCSFKPDDTEEKNVSFIYVLNDEPKISVEGPGTVFVSGVFSRDDESFSDEEEEEEDGE